MNALRVLSHEVCLLTPVKVNDAHRLCFMAPGMPKHDPAYSASDWLCLFFLRVTDETSAGHVFAILG